MSEELSETTKKKTSRRSSLVGDLTAKALSNARTRVQSQLHSKVNSAIDNATSTLTSPTKMLKHAGIIKNRRESIMYNQDENYYETISEAGKETPTMDTKSEEDPNLYQDAEGGHAKLDTDKGTEGKDKKNKKSITAKAASASGKIETPTASGSSEERMEQHMSALFDGEVLTEGFKTKAVTIFEAAINERVDDIQIDLVEQYESALVEHMESVASDLAEKLDDYLGYVVEQWMGDNEIAVESGIRADIAENFITGLKDLFDANYIDIPDEKYDIIEGISLENEALQDELNEMIQDNINMRQTMLGHTCQDIFFEEAQGLVDTDVERLATLTEGIEFESSDQYREKVKILRESYFGVSESNGEFLSEESYGEYTHPINKANGPAMNAYMGAIARHTNANRTI